MVICLEQGADLHMAQQMPLPLTVSCFTKIQIGFTFLVPAHLGSLDKGPLNGCVCVCVLFWFYAIDYAGLGQLLSTPKCSVSSQIKALVMLTCTNEVSPNPVIVASDGL